MKMQNIYSWWKFSGCNFSGGNSPERNLIGGIFRDFPDAMRIYVSGCAKSVYRYLVKIIRFPRDLLIK